MQPQLDSHLSQARQTLKTHGRSFHWASHLLGAQTAGNAACLYAFCRQLDDIADDETPIASKDTANRLSQIIAAVSGGHAGVDPVLDDFLPIMQRCNIPAEPVIHLLEGLISDQQQVALKNERELIRYCYQVAGTVGRMMCPVLGCPSTKAIPFAIDMGIGMQLTNIARDILEDAKMGRRYLPAEWVQGLSANQIASAASQPDSAEYAIIQQAAQRLLNMADEYYHSGEEGLRFLPFRARCAIAVAGRVYREIGVQLRAADLAWGSGRIVTSKGQKCAASISALSKYLFALSQDANHQSHLHDALADYIKLT